jgi:hypothetical protein
MVSPLVSTVEDLGAPTINIKKCRRWASWRVLTEIREHPPSMLENVDGVPQPPMGGFILHLGSKGCVVNLHGSDR